MKKLIIFLFLLPALLYGTSKEDFYIKSLPHNLKTLWENRSNLKSTQKLYSILVKEYNQGVTNQSLLILLPRLSFWYIENLMDKGITSKRILLKIADPGISAGETCIKLYPKNPGCYFWYVVLLSRTQSIKGVNVNTISMLKKMEKLMNVVDKLDPDYFYGGTYRYWGRVIYEVPWLVRKLAGHNLEEAINFYKKAIKVEPNFFMSHVYLAEVYLKLKEYKKARSEIDYVLKTSVNILPDVIPENKRWKRKALQLKRKYYSVLYE